MPRPTKKPRSRIGYEPHPEEAKRLMAALVFSLNFPIVKFTIWTNSSDSQVQQRTTLEFRQQKSELRRLVEDWKASGPSIQIFFRKHPEVQRRLSTVRMQIVPTTSGYGDLVCDYLPWMFNPREQGDWALAQFAPLITNPASDLLGGPCARCGNYFLKNTKKQKVYCARSCGKNQTSQVAVRRKRELDRAIAIKKAQTKIDEWSPQVHPSWKVWICNETSLSLQFLTRAANKGELMPPQGPFMRAPGSFVPNHLGGKNFLPTPSSAWPIGERCQR